MWFLVVLCYCCCSQKSDHEYNHFTFCIFFFSQAKFCSSIWQELFSMSWCYKLHQGFDISMSVLSPSRTLISHRDDKKVFNDPVGFDAQPRILRHPPCHGVAPSQSAKLKEVRRKLKLRQNQNQVHKDKTIKCWKLMQCHRLSLCQSLQLEIQSKGKKLQLQD